VRVALRWGVVAQVQATGTVVMHSPVAGADAAALLLEYIREGVCAVAVVIRLVVIVIRPI